MIRSSVPVSGKASVRADCAYTYVCWHCVGTGNGVDAGRPLENPGGGRARREPGPQERAGRRANDARRELQQQDRDRRAQVDSGAKSRSQRAGWKRVDEPPPRRAERALGYVFSNSGLERIFF